MKHSDNAIKIYKKLYFDRKQNPDNPDDPEDVIYLEHDPETTHSRVAKAIANNKKQEEVFVILLDENIFRPNSPCLIHAGLNFENLCACFVIGLKDSIDSIIDLWAITSKIYASGAGAGIRITQLRPKNSPLSSGGVASGPLAYLRVNNCVSNTVKSGGKHRRAANMGVFDYNHPDTLDIIKVKDTGELDAFNLSMLVDDYFMQNVISCLKTKSDFTLKMVSPNPLDDRKPKYRSGMEIWNTLIEKAWRTGDPGIIFLENLNKGNPFPSRGMITCTNPCGEVPLFDDTSCVIGSINVASKAFIPDAEFFKNDYFDDKHFERVVGACVEFLDQVIDKTAYIHERFEKNMKAIRPIGLGIMGFADLLIRMDIEYGSEQSITLFKKLCYHLTYAAMRKSLDMCKHDKKEPIYIFPEEKEQFIEYLKYFGATEEDINDFNTFGIRNCTWTCIAPTGSISVSADCSYSFEPTTAILWQKELAESHEIMNFFHPEFEKWVDTGYMKNFHDTQVETNRNFIKQNLIDKIIANHGSVKGLIDIPEEIQKRFRVAHDIDPIDKLKLQAAGQRYISMGISSTCNLPNDATVEQIQDIFIKSYEMGIKGMTVYRDGSKEWQPINFGRKEEIIVDDFPSNDNVNMEKWYRPLRRPRPISREGRTFEIKTPYGKLFPILNKYSDGQPMEVFFNLGGAGSHENLLYAVIGRFISTGLQHGIDVMEYISTLREAKEQQFRFKISEDQEVSYSAESILEAVGIIMESYFIHNNEKPKETIFQIDQNNGEKKEQLKLGEKCPECGYFTLIRSAGCRGGYCTNCNYTSCA